MTGSPEVIAGLLRALYAANAAFEPLHNQEHLWETDGYPELEKWFDKANRAVWRDVHHRLLKRLYKLGGMPPGVTRDPVEAFSKALTLWQDIHKACQDIYAVAEADGDYVTTDKLAEIQAVIEGWIVSAERKLRQLKTLDPKAPTTPFMTEQM